MEQLHWNNQNQNGRVTITGLQWNNHQAVLEHQSLKKWNNCNGTVKMEGTHWNNHNRNGTIKININWNNYHRPTTVKMEQSQNKIAYKCKLLLR